MSDHLDTQSKTRSAGQLGFVAAALLLSLVLLVSIPSQTEWVDNARNFAAQPRFWPSVAIVTMVLGFGAHLLRMQRRWISALDRQEMRRWVEPLEYMLWFMGYVFAVPYVGFMPLSIAFACALCWRLGYRSRGWMLSACAFAVATVVLFKAVLSVKIPGAAIYEVLPGALRSFAILYL